MTENTVARVRRIIAAGAAVVLAGGALTACTIDRPGTAAESVETTEQEPEQHDPAVISVEDGAEDVQPGEPVTVSAPDGLESVTMTNEEGKEVEAELNEEKTEWTTTEPLGYGREYTVEAVTAHGETSQSVFTTVVPDAQTHAYIGPMDGTESVSPTQSTSTSISRRATVRRRRTPSPSRRRTTLRARSIGSTRITWCGVRRNTGSPALR